MELQSMELESCQTCMSYWLSKGRNMYGYRFLSRDQHIPEAHTKENTPSAPNTCNQHMPEALPAENSQSEPDTCEGRKPQEVSAFAQPMPAEFQHQSVGDDEDKAKPSQTGFKYPCSDSTIEAYSPPSSPASARYPSKPMPPASDPYPSNTMPFACAPRPKNSLASAPRPSNPPAPPSGLSNPPAPDPCAPSVGDDKDKAKPGWARYPMPCSSCLGIEDTRMYCDDDFSGEFEDESYDESSEYEEDIDEKLMENGKKMEMDTKDSFKLYKAAMDGNWESGKNIFRKYNKIARRARIRAGSETALHVAVGSGQRSILFVKNLLHFWSKKELEMKRGDGCTSLGIAAKVGNLEAAEVLAKRHPKLINIPDGKNRFPVHHAAEYGHKEMLLYFLEETKKERDSNQKTKKEQDPNPETKKEQDPNPETKKEQDPNPYDLKEGGPKLLRLIIQAEFYDAALQLLQLVPELSISGDESYLALLLLAKNPFAFSCWRNEGVFLPLIYKCVPKPHIKQSYRPTCDVENGVTSNENLSDESHFHCRKYLVSGLRNMHHVIWTIFEQIVPLLIHIKHEKMKGYHAKTLVELLCREAFEKLETSSDAALFFKIPLQKAAENGIRIIVEEITNSFPNATWYKDDNHIGIFRLAIENRHPEVYNLLHDMGDHYINLVRQSEDDDGKNILHLAGGLAPLDRLGIVSGAALQLQRELQWFEEIESLVQPSFKTRTYRPEPRKDRKTPLELFIESYSELRGQTPRELFKESHSEQGKDGKTPRELFIESHSELRKEGEKWMRDTANSCTVVATLIATIVFAAAITVPGGNSGENGKPMLYSEKAFTIFGVADALSLFASCISLLMFLSILTSRYAVDDFLKSLPTRLIIGLLALFISVASMMVAFSATLYLMFGYQRRWILGCVIGPSCLIVATFASMHLLLLSQIIKSTYGRGMFRKRKTHGHRKFNLRWPFGSNK